MSKEGSPEAPKQLGRRKKEEEGEARTNTSLALFLRISLSGFRLCSAPASSATPVVDTSQGVANWHFFLSRRTQNAKRRR